MQQMLIPLILVSWNLITFGIMGKDKRSAKLHKRRTPEKELLLYAFLLGGVGILAGMLFFRHKTKHLKFVVFVPVFVVINSIIFYYLAFHLIQLSSST